MQLKVLRTQKKKNLHDDLKKVCVQNKKITKNIKNGAMIIFYHIEEKLEGLVVFF